MGNMILSVSPAIVSVISVVLFIVGLGAGFLIFKVYTSKKLDKNKSNAIKIIEDAYAEAKTNLIPKPVFYPYSYNRSSQAVRRWPRV